MPILHKGKEYPSIQANGQFFQIENEILFFEQKGYVIGVDLEFGQRIFKHKTDSKNSALKVVDGNLVEVYVDKGYDTVIAKISSLK